MPDNRTDSTRPWARWAAAGVLSAAVGMTVGLLMPRGPVTTLEAVLCVLTALVIGAGVGILARSRWWLLLGPIALVVSFEAARLSATGPTVDAIGLDSVYGILALIVGRGVDGFLLVLPFLVGTGAAVAWIRQHEGRRTRLTSRIGLTLGGAVIIALLAGLLRPAGTEPIDSPDSIAELSRVEIGGHEQHLMIRGDDRDAPILLFLEGGPGGSAMGRMRKSGEALEEHFVVVTWDQRGTGKSYAALDPVESLTVEQMVSDCLEVTDHLRERFDEDRIYLVGSSWGTILGVLAVQERPDVFHAYVGTGQMVDPFETDQLMYAENLAQAKRTGDAGRADRLREIGPPPYSDTLHYPEALASNPEWMNFPHGADYSSGSEYPLAFFAGEYTLIEQMRGMASIAETFAVLYPQLADIDLRAQAEELSVPVYIVAGKYEADGRRVLAEEWFNDLEAPHKEWIDVRRSGHTPPYDEPGRFADAMADIAGATGGPRPSTH